MSRDTSVPVARGVAAEALPDDRVAIALRPVIGATMAAAVLDATLFVGVVSGGLSIGRYALGHTLVAAAAGGLAWRLRHQPRASRDLWVLAVACLGLGAFGAVGTLLTVLLGRFYDRRRTPIEDWHTALFPEIEVDKDKALWAVVAVRQLRGGEVGAAPLVDLLRHGTLAQKQAVVALVARHFRPAFAPALRLALRDASNAVRVQAATAVSLIEARVTTEALSLDRQRQARPGDLDVVLALARHEDAYAFTGLLDTTREHECRRRAVHAYREYIAARPQDAMVRHELGRLLLRLGRTEEARESFEAALALQPSAEAGVWLMECLFLLRRFDDLRRLACGSAASVAESPTLPVEAREAVGLWAGEVCQPS